MRNSHHKIFLKITRRPFMNMVYNFKVLTTVVFPRDYVDSLVIFPLSMTELSLANINDIKIQHTVTHSIILNWTYVARNKLRSNMQQQKRTRQSSHLNLTAFNFSFSDSSSSSHISSFLFPLFPLH